MLLRTFSKVYGLAGMRVGFALCGSSDVVRAVDQVRQPFFCNAAAQAAAVEALRHQDAVAERVDRAVVARIELDEGLREIGIEPAELAGELLLVRAARVGVGEPEGDGGARPAAACGIAVCWSAPAPRSAARVAARDVWHARRRTPASSPRCATSCPPDRRRRWRAGAVVCFNSLRNEPFGPQRNDVRILHRAVRFRLRLFGFLAI